MALRTLSEIWASMVRPPNSKPLLYMEVYDAHFAALRDAEITIVEVGIFQGHFLKALIEYFSRARIIGIDRRLPADWTPHERISLFEADQSDTKAIHQIFDSAAPNGVDVIIDDASHLAIPSHVLFKATFEQYLNPGGLYFIEDWGVGYQDHLIDNAAYDGDFEYGPVHFQSHDCGLVGIIKCLIDELRPIHTSYVESITLWRGNALFTKKASIVSP